MKNHRYQNLWMYPMYSAAGKTSEFFKELAADAKERYEKAISRPVSVEELYETPAICPHCGAKKE